MSGNGDDGTAKTFKARSREEGDGYQTDLFDRFGILRSDEPSKSSDSVPIEDPSLFLTDDDTSARVLDANTVSGNTGLSDFRVQLEDLTADHTGASEDFSKTSDAPKTSRAASGSATASQQQDETESLTEFEEFERLIKANTADDSDDDLSDIPEDLEQKILSGRKSRESMRSGARSEPHSPPPLTAAGNSAASDIENRTAHRGDDDSLLKGTAAHQDTGYVSAGDPSAVHISAEEDSNIALPDDQSLQVRESDAENDQQPAIPEHTQGMGSARGSLSQEPLHSGGQIKQFTSYDATTEESSSSSSDENNADDTRDSDLAQALDHFLVPTQRTDTNQPDSLVATFGTTEDFEVLLKQQLEDMSMEEMPEASGRLVRSGSANSLERLNASGDRRMTSTKRKKLPEEPAATFGSRSSSKSRSSRRGSPAGVAPRVKPSPMTKLRLTTSNKKSPRDYSGSSNPGSVSHSSRNPPRYRNQPGINDGRSSAILQPESSDDTSARSDLSRSELRVRLKEEEENRKREEELVKQLQSNYDALLMKYAQAENTIDHLRVGAKINLSVAVPKVDPEDPTLPFEEARWIRRDRNGPQQASHLDQDPSSSNVNERGSPAMRASTPGSPFHYRSPSASSLGASGSTKPGHLIEGSMKLPAAASAEFLRVALQLQAKDLEEKIASFNTLLQENQLDPEEQQQALETIEECLRNLERDYLHAIDEHAAEQRRLRMATGGSIDPGTELDPGRVIESDIGRLATMVSDAREAVANRNKARDLPSARNLVENEGPTSGDGDVDDKFNQLLHKYKRPLQTDKDTTAAPSLNLSSDEGESFSPRPIPSQYLEPSNELNASTASHPQQSPTSLPSPTPRSSKRPRHRSSFSSMAESVPSTSPSPTRRQQSRLPRPVSRGGGKERRTPSSEERKSQQTDKGTDSGFVGSESSRQSKTQSPPQPVKAKLVARPSTGVDARTDIIPTDKRSRQHSGDTSTTMGSSARRDPKSQNLRPAPSPSYYKSPQAQDDTMDDVSTTSTVREMLRPRHAARSYSTSTATSQATTVKQKTSGPGFPRGSHTGASVKSKDSGRRSIGSSTRDSALDAIRGEISRLRNEIKKAKNNEKENFQPTLVSTPRAPPNRVDEPAAFSDSETLRAIRNDIQALKDEMQRRKPRKEETDGASVKSAEPSTGRSRGTDRGRRSQRSRSLGRDDLSEAGSRRYDSSPDRSRRQRSRSHTRSPWQGGYWTYVPPAPFVAPVWGPPAPSAGRIYTRPASPVHVVNATPVVTPPQVVHTPIIGPPPNVVYVESPTVAQPSTTGRVYLPTSSRHTRIYTTPSKPKASVYISPRGNPSQSVRKASVYIVDSESEDVPLRRSHLNLRKSSSMSKLGGHRRSSAFVVMPDSRLNDSIDRAERSAEDLRSRSRSMYRSLRDDLYRTQLMADTM